MSIFKKRETKELPPLMSDAEIYGATYEQVIDFLVAVNDKDYQKIIKVAEITRAHYVEVAKVTGMKPGPVPSIFEQQTVPAVPINKTTDTEAGDFLDDDELTAAFRDDDEPKHIDHKTPKSKARKVPVKNVK